MITETSGFEYLGTDCGYRWIPSVDRGLPKGSSLGKAVAVVIDEQVVSTFPTYPPLFDAMMNGQLVDVSSNYSFPESDSVIDVIVNGETAHTLHISDALLAAAMASNPTLVEITADTPAVTTGWRFSNGQFSQPA